MVRKAAWRYGLSTFFQVLLIAVLIVGGTLFFRSQAAKRADWYRLSIEDRDAVANQVLFVLYRLQEPDLGRAVRLDRLFSAADAEGVELPNEVPLDRSTTFTLVIERLRARRLILGPEEDKLVQEVSLTSQGLEEAERLRRGATDSGALPSMYIQNYTNVQASSSQVMVNSIGGHQEMRLDPFVADRLLALVDAVQRAQHQRLLAGDATVAEIVELLRRETTAPRSEPGAIIRLLGELRDLLLKAGASAVVTGLIAEVKNLIHVLAG